MMAYANKYDGDTEREGKALCGLWVWIQLKKSRWSCFRTIPP